MELLLYLRACEASPHNLQQRHDMGGTEEVRPHNTLLCSGLQSYRKAGTGQQCVW